MNQRLRPASSPIPPQHLKIEARLLLLILALLAAPILSAAAAPEAGQPQAEADRLSSGPPPKDKPAVPGWGFWEKFPTAWQATFKGQLAREKQGKIDLVFLGDSITQGWGGEGKALWDERFAPLGAVNFGIGGDSTRQVLWRLDHGLVDGLAPKAVVLKIGTNNLYGDFNAGSDEEIAQGISAIVKELQTKLPGARLVLCGILPRQNEYFTNRIFKINAQIKRLADGKTVYFLDLAEKYETAPGKVIPELYVPDQVHLSAKGYQIWADALTPLLPGMSK
jgi:platelet-activating factor acetylhydrolase IB subunit beta/gamma